MPIGIYVMITTEINRTEIINQLITKLQNARLEQGLSLNQVAKRAGLDQTMVGRLEKRTRQPTIDTLLRLSDALGTDFPALLSSAISSSQRPGASLQRISSHAHQSPAPPPAPRPSPIKMTDLAANLGLSRLTVSAVLNNRHEDLRISAKTVQRVREAATRLGYVRNRLAIATKTGRTSSVGIMVSDFSSHWVSRILRGFLREARARHLLVNIEEVSGHESELTALTKFMEQRIGGIFCCNLHPAGNFPEVIAETSLRYSCPVVNSISQQSLPGLHVDSDDRDGMQQVAAHLWKLGHRKIACIGLASEPQRTAFMVQGIKNLGGDVPAEWILERQSANPEFEPKVLSLLAASNHHPTAVICATDELAAVTMRAANQAGLNVPDDLSITGFSGDRIGPLLQSRLTTVTQPFEDMGRRAAERLVASMQRIENSAETALKELLPVSLIVRESTARAMSPAR